MFAIEQMASHLLKELPEEIPECSYTKVDGQPAIRIRGKVDRLNEVLRGLTEGGSHRVSGMPAPERLLSVRLANIYSVKRKLEIAFPYMHFCILQEHNLIVATGYKNQVSQARTTLLKLDTPGEH